MWDCEFGCLAFLFLANAVLLVLCWLPPTVRLWIKILVTIVFFLPPLLTILDSERVYEEIAAALGQGNQLFGVPLSDAAHAFCSAAELGFILLVVVVQVRVAWDATNRWRVQDLNEPDDEGGT